MVFRPVMSFQSSQLSVIYYNLKKCNKNNSFNSKDIRGNKNNYHQQFGKKISVSGNRTPVARVTGGNTHHYTNTDLVGETKDKTIFETNYRMEMKIF